MGCLLFPFELIFDGMIECWFSLMQWIVPDKTFSKGFRIALKILVGIFSAILIFIMFLGIFALISDDQDTKLLGKYMVFVPLGISAIQIILGMIVRRITNKDKK